MSHVADTAPVPLSFPAVLRNPKLPDRFAHLRRAPSPEASLQRRANKDRPELQGKRWVRRRENAKFAHNPHVALPTSADFDHPLQVPSSTFPRPLPSCLPRSVPAPHSRPPPALPSTSTAGLFSLSLRGVRRTLRARPSSAHLVRAVETHLATWLEGGTYLDPDQARGLLCFPGEPVGGRDDVREVAREAARLVWVVKADGYHDGGFERYVVHCVARWYGVVSFSKEADGHRLTYLLRPNISRPDPRAGSPARTLDTPPATDASDFHVSDTHTTDTSDIDSVSDGPPIGAGALSDIEESRPSSPASWSVVGGSDFAIDSENDADDPGFAASMESLSLSAHAEDDVLATPSVPSYTQSAAATARVGPADPDRHGESRARIDRDRLRTLCPRSTSSPSPARRPPRRLSTARKLSAKRKRKTKNGRSALAGAVGTDKGSFYDYLFA